MLRSYKLQSTLAILCYALILAAALALAIEMTVLFHTDDTEGVGGAVVKLAAILLGLIGGIAAIASLIPFVLRLLSLKWRRIWLYSVCAVFDLLFMLLGAATIVDGILGGDYDPSVYLLGAAMIAVAAVALCCNVLSIRLLRAEKRGSLSEAHEN